MVLELTGTLMSLMVTLPAFAKSMLQTNTYSPIVFKLLHPKSIWGAYYYQGCSLYNKITEK